MHDSPSATPVAMLRIAVFAGLADAVGSRWIDLPWAGGTAAEARRMAAERHPQAAPLLARSTVARGERYVADDERLAAGDDVAIIPPVSGG